MSVVAESIEELFSETVVSLPLSSTSDCSDNDSVACSTSDTDVSAKIVFLSLMKLAPLEYSQLL